MRNIIYYVASSLDGYIAGPGENIDGFVSGGNGLDQYVADLQQFDTVIMGRKTYEFGYRFGLQPGQPAYPHMRHYIFSNHLQLENPHELVKVCPPNLENIRQLKSEKGTDIYCCGGGEFAGWLLNHELIDLLKIKLNPLVLGNGIRLFGNSSRKVLTELMDSRLFDRGLQLITYKILY